MAKRVTIRLTDELEAYANASGIPVATAIRELAVKGLRNNGDSTRVQQVPSNNYKDALLALVKIVEEETSADTSYIYELLGEVSKNKNSSQKKVSARQESLAKTTAKPVEEPIKQSDEKPAQSNAEPSQRAIYREEPVKPIVEEENSNDEDDIAITEDTDAPISDDIMASLNEMLGII